LVIGSWCFENWKASWTPFFSVNTHRVSQVVLNLYSHTLVSSQERIFIIEIDVCKVMKNQHENPGIGHKLNEIFFKTCKKVHLALNRGVKLRKPSILVIIEFHPVFPFCLSASSASTYIFTCSYLQSYYNYSQTLCIKWWVSAFHSQI
jgi:hypothetical protein